MTSKNIDIAALEAHKGSLLTLLDQDDEIILTEDGRPIARLTRVEQSLPTGVARVPDLFPGIWMSEDFTAPLPDEFWSGDE